MKRFEESEVVKIFPTTQFGYRKITVERPLRLNRYFYKYTPPRPLEEIEADIRIIEKDVLRMLGEVTRDRS